MKKKVLAIALVTVFTGMGVAQAADVTAQAVATWSATAKKDTTSKLVVTPLGSLAFQYAEGIKGFNSQKGLFDVAIEGDSTATAFKYSPSRILFHLLDICKKAVYAFRCAAIHKSHREEVCICFF